jgi:class II aldolase/adducin N-terminal domain-containing protein
VTETGGVKFRAERLTADMQPCLDLAELNLYRSKLRERQFIGQDANGIGFGNISVKAKNETGFFITISGGAIRESIGQADLVWVKSWSFAENLVRFEGPGTPSAETLTHAAIYGANRSAGAILHIHNRSVWDWLVAHAQATADAAEYGTTAMAETVQEFLDRSTCLTNVFAMSGHEEGVLAFGRDLAEAYASLMSVQPGRDPKV